MAKVCLYGKQAQLDLKASFDMFLGEALLPVLFISFNFFYFLVLAVCSSLMSRAYGIQKVSFSELINSQNCACCVPNDLNIQILQSHTGNPIKKECCSAQQLPGHVKS